MYSRTVLLSEAGYKSDVVEDDHFEANAIYTRDYSDPGGPFDRMFTDLGWSGLRFPGGTVTEENFAPGSGIVERLFDVSRPSGLSDDGAPRIVTTPAMFSYAIDKGIAVDFTLPTDNYFSDETDEDGFRIPSTFGLYRILDRVDEMVRGDYQQFLRSRSRGGVAHGSRGKSVCNPHRYGVAVRGVPATDAKRPRAF